MIEERLEDYMKKITIKSDKVAEYRDEEKGLVYPMTTAQLLARVDYLELTKEELQKAKFEQKVENKEYKMYDCDRPVPKSTITKDKKDQFTITNSKVKATHIYNVTNQVGIHTTFEDKDEAIKLCDEINKKIYEKI